jgi:hypothetical protein
MSYRSSDPHLLDAHRAPGVRVGASGVEAADPAVPDES